MSQTFVASADITPPFSVHHEPKGDDWGYETPLTPPALPDWVLRPLTDPALEA